MRHSTKKPTILEAARMAKLKQMPCIACLANSKYGKRFLFWCGEVEVHHILSGNRRKGHAFTIPLGRWHHRGEPFHFSNVRDMEVTFGPSLARSSRRFKKQFGTEQELLDKVNDLLGGEL